MQLGQTQIVDLLGDLRPIDIIYPLTLSKAAEQFGLALRPSPNIAFIKTIGHAT